MDEWDAWQTFFASGRVIDYLKYKTYQNAKNNGAEAADTINREISDEIPDGRTDNQRTEYW